MLKRYDLWMADWRDAKGNRHRKGFPTKAAASRHQTKMQREAAAKKARPRRAARRPSSKPSPRPAPNTARKPARRVPSPAASQTISAPTS